MYYLKVWLRFYTIFLKQHSRPNCDRGEHAGSLPRRRRSQNDSNRGLYLPTQCKHLFGKLGRSQLWNHFFWQHWVCHVNRLPMCDYGGMDSHPILGKAEFAYSKSLSNHKTAIRVRYIIYQANFVWNVQKLEIEMHFRHKITRQTRRKNNIRTKYK